MKTVNGKISGNFENSAGKKLHELFKHLTEAVTFINITLAVWLQHC